MNELVDLFKAMSDQTRLRIMILLYQKNHCVCELTEILKVPQSKISKHLGKLRDLGLVTTSRDAQFIYYQLDMSEPLFKSIFEAIHLHKSAYPKLILDSETACFCTKDKIMNEKVQ